MLNAEFSKRVRTISSHQPVASTSTSTSSLPFSNERPGMISSSSSSRITMRGSAMVDDQRLESALSDAMSGPPSSPSKRKAYGDR